MEVSVSDDEDDQLILLVCTTPTPTPTPDPYHNHPIEEILTDIILSDLSTFLNFHTIKLHAHRNRLIHHSLYFRGLLSGSFSESCLGSITINWNLPVFMQILKHIYGCSLDITSQNVLPLYEGALYFGVDTLIVKCEDWFSEVFSRNEFPSTQIQTEDLIQIWKFASDHASDFILHLCIGYLARNFMWAKKNNFFREVPYNLLLSSVKHPHLTVDSEMHLSDALLLWLESNMENLERRSEAEDNYNGILKQVYHFLELLPEALQSIYSSSTNS